MITGKKKNRGFLKRFNKIEENHMRLKTIKIWASCVVIAGITQGLIEKGILVIISGLILMFGAIIPMLYLADKLSAKKTNWQLKHTLIIMIILIASPTITTGLAASFCYLAINNCSQELWSLFVVNILVCVVPPMIRLFPQLQKSVNDEDKLK